MMGKPASQDDRFGAKPAGFANGMFEADVRKSMNSAFEAMSEWRDEMAASTERYQTKVFDKMAAAAKAAGWPEQMVEASKTQMQQMSKMQLQMVDQMMDAWTEQMKNPGKLTFGLQHGGFPGMGNMPSFPGFPTFPGFQVPGMDLAKYGFGTNPMAPFQFWMEATQLWQKQWADAMTQFMNGLPGNGNPPRKGR